MLLLIKSAGLCLVLLGCTAGGFMLSLKLERRVKALNGICLALGELCERIRLCDGEIRTLLNSVFSNTDILRINSRCEPEISDCGLNQGDRELIMQYLNNIGMGDSTAECNKARLYITLFEKQRDIAEQDLNAKAKLYRTLGILAGLCLCVFFA